jgi:hypothetical protein
MFVYERGRHVLAGAADAKPQRRHAVHVTALQEPTNTTMRINFFVYLKLFTFLL